MVRLFKKAPSDETELEMSQEDGTDLEPVRTTSRWRHKREDKEIRIHPRAQRKRKEDMEKNPNVKVGGDLNVLERKDDYYCMAALVSGILTLGSFIGSMYVIGDIIMPASESLNLVLRTCTVQQVKVVDRKGTPLPDVGTYINLLGDEVERESGAITCWRACEDEGETCTWSRGYGYCEHATRALPTQRPRHAAPSPRPCRRCPTQRYLPSR